MVHFFGGLELLLVFLFLTLDELCVIVATRAGSGLQQQLSLHWVDLGWF
jgi:hypothetical protein